MHSARGRGSAALASLLPALLLTSAAAVAASAVDVHRPRSEPVTIYVDSSAAGSDGATGSQASPFATLRRARDKARQVPGPARVVLSGVFHETLRLNSAMDSGVTWEGQPKRSGGALLSGAATSVIRAGQWRPHAHTKGVWETTLPAALARRIAAAEKFDGPDRLGAHLFMNGRKVPRVRTATMMWDAPLGVTADLSYNSFCELYGDFKLVPECFGFKFTPGAIPADWNITTAALRKWRVKAYHAWCTSWHAVKAVHRENNTIVFENAAENPFGAQEGSGGRRWLIEGADEIPLQQGSGQWRLETTETPDGPSVILQYAPLAQSLKGDYEPAARVGQACRPATASLSDFTCDSVCCTGDCPGAVGQHNLTTCLQACEDSPQCRFATFWSPPHGAYCYLQRYCGEVYQHPDGEVVQVFRKRRTAPQRRRLSPIDGPGEVTLQLPVLTTVLEVGPATSNVSFANFTVGFSRDLCAQSPGGCSNVGRDGAGPNQTMVRIDGPGVSFSRMEFVGSGNAAFVSAARNVRSAFSDCGGNCVESSGDGFLLLHSWLTRYGTSYPSASGVKLTGGKHSVVSNCDVSDGYSAAVMATSGNDRGAGTRIQFNRLHNIRPQAVDDGVSDSVCGVYTSTFKATQQMYFHHNEVFDVESWSGNGGAGYYSDGGSTAWTITTNLIHTTGYFPLERNSNWQGGSGGAPSYISNNLLVANAGGEADYDGVPPAWVGRSDGIGRGTIEWEMWIRNETFTNNVVVATHGGSLVFTGDACNSSWNPGARLGPDCSNRYEDNFRFSTFDRNVYWVVEGQLNRSAVPVPPLFPDRRQADNGRKPASAGEGIEFGEWQKLGHDVNSVVADPLLRDPERGDYTLMNNSPALKMGFIPIDRALNGPDWSGALSEIARGPEAAISGLR